MTRHYYKDFATGERRFTRGTFSRWERGGPLGAWGAVFSLRASEVWIPVYLLERETRERLPKKPR